MKKKKKNSKFKLIALLFITISVPLTVFLSQKVQNYINHAAETDRKVALGISLPYGPASKDENIYYQIAEIERFASRLDEGGVGAYPASYSIWNRFSDDWEYGARSTFPNQKLLDYLDSKNITPMIFMEPTGTGNLTSDNNLTISRKYGNQAIANGSMDDYFISWANAAKSYGKPVILRYAHEMNYGAFPWVPDDWKINYKYTRVGNNPQNYVAAWRHIYDLIKPIAPNVKFFWSPNVINGNLNSVAYNRLESIYPGNKYVDFVGLDSYNWYPQRPKQPDQSLADLYEDTIIALRYITNNKTSGSLSKKPIIIGETGVIYNNAFRDDRMNYRVIYNKYPDVVGITYFDIDMNSRFGNNNENSINWRLSGKSDDPNILNNGMDIRPKYAGFLNEERFQGKYNSNTLNFSATSITSFTYQPTDGSPIGYHDSTSCTVSSGWTCDSSDFSSNIKVDFYIDGLPYSGGKFIGSTIASSQREQAVAALCGGKSNHGFVFNMPTGYKDGKKHTVYAIAKNISTGYNIILEKSPKSFTCQ